MQNNETTTRDDADHVGLACFDCDHISADLYELHNHIWRNH